MKNVFLLSFLATMLLGGTPAHAKDKIISHPPYKLSGGGLNLQTVIQTDTATVLCFKNTSSNWSLVSTVHLRANGKDYAYRYGKLVDKKEGQITEFPLSLDSTYITPYTLIGEKVVRERDSLVLSFDKIPAETQTFDFLEGNDYQAWKTIGIKMDGQPYPSSLPKSEKVPDIGLPACTIQPGKAVLKGKIYDYEDQYMRFGIGYLANANNLVGNQLDLKTVNDSLGNFSFETELTHPTPYSIILPGGQLRVILIPGEVIEMDVDVAARTALTLFHEQKKTVKPNKALQFKGKFGPMNEALNNNKFDGNTVAFLKNILNISFDEYVQQLWKEYQQTLQKIAANKEHNSQQREFLKLRAQSTYLFKRINYISNIKDGFYFSNMKMDSLAMSKYTAQFTLVDPHAKELPLFDNLNALYVIPNYSPMEYLKVNGFEKSDLYQWMADLKKAKELAGRINMMQVVNDSTEWNSIAPQYIPALKQQNELVIKKKAEAENRQLKGVIKEVPDVSGEELIQTIVNSHKDKVVVIDCWATWCGPCKTGIAKMEPLKQALNGKDVVFVYLTNETSDINTWMKEVEKLKGEHYRISSLKWSQLPDITAIPHYLIYDRQGNKIMDKTGWNDKLVNEFKEIITNALDKKGM